MGQAGQTVFFTDNSLNAWTWDWNFGDPASGANNTSTIQNPQHVYATNGNYTVTLIVTNNYGCADTTVKNGFAQVHVGIDESASETFSVFPNPFTEQITLVSSTTVSDVSLMDLTGKQIPVRLEGLGTNQVLVRLETTIAAGVYILKADDKLIKLITY